MDNQTVIWVMIGLVFVVMLLPIVIFGPLFRLWLMCLLSGAPVMVSQLVGMKLRRSPVKHLCELYIMSRQAGLDVRLDQIENAYKAGADVELVVRAMIKASRTGQNLTWDEALEQAMQDQYDDYVEENYGDGEQSF